MIGIDVMDQKLELAKEVGAVEVINVKKVGKVSKAISWGGGTGWKCRKLCADF